MRMMTIIILAALLLAACAVTSTETPALPTLAATQPADAAQVTPNADQPTVETAETAGPPTATVSSIQQAIGMLPPPGTIQVPVTEEASSETALPFKMIAYEESGGPANASLYVEIYADGSVFRNGAQSMASLDVVAELNQMIQDLHFFALEGQFTRPGSGSDAYNYYVRVELQDGSARSLDAQDRATPPELLRLFSALRNLGT